MEWLDRIKKEFKWWGEFFQSHKRFAAVVLVLLLLYFLINFGGENPFFIIWLIFGAMFGLAFSLEGQMFLAVLFVVWQLIKRWRKSRRGSNGKDVDGMVETPNP